MPCRVTRMTGLFAALVITVAALAPSHLPGGPPSAPLAAAPRRSTLVAPRDAGCIDGPVPARPAPSTEPPTVTPHRG